MVNTDPVTLNPTYTLTEHFIVQSNTTFNIMHTSIPPAHTAKRDRDCLVHPRAPEAFRFAF